MPAAVVADGWPVLPAWAGRAHDGSYEGTRAAARRHLPGSLFSAPAPLRPAQRFAVCDQVTHGGMRADPQLSVSAHVRER